MKGKKIKVTRKKMMKRRDGKKEKKRRTNSKLKEIQKGNENQRN